MMQFTLSSLLISFVVVSAALAAFGPIYGFIISVMLISAVAIVRCSDWPFGVGTAVLCFWAIVLLLILSSWARPPHGPNYPMHCQNNLKQLSLALQSYRQVVGHYPPAYVNGPEGKPWHSWRVLLLPYIEQKSLYQQYRFDEPWNGPNNRKLATWAPELFVCPTRSHKQPNTNYLAVVGPQAAWLGETPRKATDFCDAALTIQLVESPDSGICWMEPRDISLEDVLKVRDSDGRLLILSTHAGPSGNVTMANGAFERLPATLSAETLRALLTVDSQKPHASEDIDHAWKMADKAQEEANAEALKIFNRQIAVLLGATLLLLLRPNPRWKKQSQATDKPAPAQTEPADKTD